MEYFPRWIMSLLWIIAMCWLIFGKLPFGGMGLPKAAALVVTDPVNLKNNIRQQVQTMLQWKQQIEQMTQQINQLERQHKILTGSRNLGAIFNNPDLRNYLPQDWQAVYDRVRAGGYSGLTRHAQTIHAENQLFDSCSRIQDPEQRMICEARAVKPAQDKSFALTGYQAAKNRMQQLDKLMQEIDKTQDPKAMAELQGRIAIEQANIQNEQTKLQMYALIADADNRLQEQREYDLAMKDAAKRGGLNVRPMKFSNKN